MAYDPNSAYQPQQRAYSSQTQQQQAPIQQDYRDQTQERYRQGSYDQGYGQEYGQGYEQQQQQQYIPPNGYGAPNGYGQQHTNAAQQEGYSDGYHAGYQKQKTTPISGKRLQQQRQAPAPQQAQQQPQYERSYDPRYQARSGRATPQGHGHKPAQKVQQQPQAPMQDSQGYQPQQQQPTPRERQGYQAPPAKQPRFADPHNGYPQPSPQQRQPAALGAPPGEQQRPVESHTAPSAQKVAPPPMEAPKKMTMEEWKAAEKAKMHAASASPETPSFDNAFPVFPNTKKKERLDPNDRSGTVMTKRSSEEQSRSSIASSGPKHGEHVAREQRPGMPRDNSYQNEAQQQQSHLAPQGRPSMDHKPFSFEPVAPRDEQQQQRQPQRPSYDRQPSDRRAPQQARLPADDRQRQQWPAQSAPPREDQRSPPQAKGYQHPPPPAQDQYSRPAYTQQHQAPLLQQQTRPGTAAGGSRPPVPAIDTAQARRPLAPTHMDHQPLSPAHVPPRPSTVQAGRSPPGANLQVASSPLSGLSYSHTPVGYAAGDPPLPEHGKQESLGELYEGNHEVEPAAPVSAGGMRSDREIEEEMPDFDSAAPSQTSLLQKRIGKQVAQAQLPGRSVQSGGNSKAGGYQQPSDPYRDMVQQKQVRVGGAARVVDRGFDFGLPQQQQQAAHQHYQYDEGYAQRDPAYQSQQQAPPVQPPQPPFATGPPARKSMDEARQMPYRQGASQPQAQGVRFAAGGQAPRGQYAPQQRPEMDERNLSGETVQTMRSEGSGQVPRGAQRPGMEERGMSGQTVQTLRSDMSGQPPRGAYPPQPRPGMDERNLSGQTVQTVWSDPGQRVPSAPPLRQGLQAPPNGVQLSQQRSAPEYHQQRHSNPDALPHHPTPVRPGLMEGVLKQQPSKPAPVRNYDAASVSSHGGQVSIERPAQPVTHQELDQLRAAVTANPNNNKQALLLAKKLVEASTVLASENGRADPKTTARNREKYILDAHKRTKKLASAGYPDAQFYLADCYGQGALGLEVDTKEAFNMYQAAAKQGHPQAAYRTAVCCEMGPEEGGGTRKDYAKAAQWYRRAAALGDVPAMYKLGIILLKGLLGQQRNVGESVTWLKRAAEPADKANPHALHELGTLYESSNTDPDIRNKIVADDGYARSLFTQASQLGYKSSQFRLGQAYEYGALGLPIDNRASISWYSKAAAQGEHQAELALSGWYLTGAEGILEQSDTEAYLWARKAAQAGGGEGGGLGKAMFAMGYFSEMGIGCPASGEEARRWYGRAASYKFPKAVERLEELKKSGKSRPAPVNGKLARKDQKRDEAECAVM